MTFDELKNKIASKFTAESSAEDLLYAKEVNEQIDALSNDYKNLKDENAKLKDAVADMVLKSGNATPPPNPSGNEDNKPRTLEEIANQKLKEKGEK